MHKPSKQIVVLVALALVSLTVTALCVREYQHAKNIKDAAVVKALKERDTARIQAYQADLNAASSKEYAQTIAQQKATACATIVAAKLKSPVCQ